VQTLSSFTCKKKSVTIIMYKMLLISNNYLLMRFLDVIIKYFIHLFNAVNKWCVPVITACFITWY